MINIALNGVTMVAARSFNAAADLARQVVDRSLDQFMAQVRAIEQDTGLTYDVWLDQLPDEEMWRMPNVTDRLYIAERGGLYLLLPTQQSCYRVGAKIMAGGAGGDWDLVPARVG